MKRKNFLVIVAVVVLLIVFGSQWQQTAIESELITVQEVNMDDQLRGFLENQSKVWQAALAAHEAIGSEPDLDLYTLIAANAKHRGDLLLAKETYEAYFELHQVNHTAYSSYGGVLRRMGDLEGARQAYTRAIELDGDEEAYYLSLIRVLDEMGLMSDVEDTYKDAIAAVGQTQALLVGLAEWYEEHGDCESAVSHYEVARQLAEDEVVEAQIDELISEVEATCQ